MQSLTPDFNANAGGNVRVHVPDSWLRSGSPWALERLVFEQGRVAWKQAAEITPAAKPVGTCATFGIPADVRTGYHRLRPKQVGNAAIPMPVNGADAGDAAVAVVRPVFTEWSYDVRGFYPSQAAPAVSFQERLLNKYRRTFSLPPRFPARQSVCINRPYRRNWRWSRAIWSCEWGDTDHGWNDEILSAWPTYLLLDRLGIPYRVYSDIDLHAGAEDIFRHRTLILYGTDGITKEYYETLRKFVSDPGRRLILWCCQGIGYRQYAFDRGSGVLSHVATRGRTGMWGDRLDARDPDWDESELFGFRFPTPGSSNWRYEAEYRTLEVADRSHWLIEKAGLKSDRFDYEIKDTEGTPHAGLMWAGGEFFEPAHPEARVVMRVAEGSSPRIGVGEFRNVLMFSPTYLPAYWLWQNPNHPEIESLLAAAVSGKNGWPANTC